MPHYRNPFEKGDLFIKFEVQFPENNWISAEKLTVSVTVYHRWAFVSSSLILSMGSTFSWESSGVK